jgi:hypothetical protein
MGYHHENGQTVTPKHCTAPGKRVQQRNTTITSPVGVNSHSRHVWSTDPEANRLPVQFQPSARACNGHTAHTLLQMDNPWVVTMSQAEGTFLLCPDAFRTVADAILSSKDPAAERDGPLGRDIRGATTKG